MRPDPRFAMGQGRRPGPRPVGFAGWSTRRKLRLARTLAIVLLLAVSVWRCNADDGGEPVATGRTTTTLATTTTEPRPATTATAAGVDGPLPEVRSLGAAGAAGSGEGAPIVIAGGLDGTRNSTAAVWTFDPATGTSAVASGKLPGPRHGAAMATLGDAALVLGGAKGSSVSDDVLSVSAAGEVAALGSLPAPRANAVALGDPTDGSVTVFGGWNGKEPTNEVLRTTDGTAFTTVATLLQGTRFPAVAQLGRSVWVVGGELGSTIVTNIQRVDLDSGAVTDVGVLPVGLSRASGFTLGGSIFVAGGRTADGRSDQIYRIDPITGGVTIAGTLPEARSDAAVAVSGTTAYLLGGLTPKPARTVVAITAS